MSLDDSFFFTFEDSDLLAFSSTVFDFAWETSVTFDSFLALFFNDAFAPFYIKDSVLFGKINMYLPTRLQFFRFGLHFDLKTRSR